MKFPPAQTQSRVLNTRVFEAFLVGLILLGIGCRFTGLNWDEGAQLHPDERFVMDIISRIGWPASWSQWFDSARSPFNPANSNGAHYVYGQWPLLLGKAAFALAQHFGYDTLSVVGRGLSALCDSLTVGLTFLLSRRVLPRMWALFATALVALAALGVQQSHFFTVDNFAACWMLASFCGAARWHHSGRARDALISGVCLGVAMACKISAIFIAVPLLVFFVMSARKHPKRQLFWGAVVCALVALVCFRVFQPMAFMGEFGFFDVRLEPRFWGDLAQQSAITRGEVDVPFDVQWIGRTPWLFSLRNLGFWGYGWGTLVSGALGIALVMVRAFKRDLRADERGPILLASALFCLVLLGAQGATFSKFTRYFLPMTPFVALLGAYFWQTLVESPRWRVLRFCAPLVAGFSALWCVAVAGIYGRTQTRIEASRWIVSHIPPGTAVANETVWDENLPLAWIPSGNGGLRSQLLDSYALDTLDKREKMLRILNESEWIFLSSGRSWQNIPRWPAKWPMTSRFYYALWSGELGFVHEREFTSYPSLGPLQFPDDNAEEALSVYDHPRVILWKKGPNYSPAKAREILEAAQLPTKRDWQPRRAGSGE